MIDAEASYRVALTRKTEAETRKVQAEARKLRAEAAAIDFSRRRDRALLLVSLPTALLGLLGTLLPGCG
jgi:hypothetical protein